MTIHADQSAKYAAAEPVAELRDRLLSARDELRKLADEATDPERINHLQSKRQGVELAISYTEDTLRLILDA